MPSSHLSTTSELSGLLIINWSDDYSIFPLYNSFPKTTADCPMRYSLIWQFCLPILQVYISYFAQLATAGAATGGAAIGGLQRKIGG